MRADTVDYKQAPITTPGAVLQDKEFASFRDLIYRIAGIHLSDAKKVLLAGRLHRRLQHHGLASYGDYFRLIDSGKAPDELQIMVDLLTTNETYFFREDKHFDFLRNHIQTRLRLRQDVAQDVSIWSAACSTGEEVYTLAMVLADELGLERSWTITGSDISTRVLKTATAGHYSLDRTRGLPDAYLRKYCLKGVRENAGTFLIDPQLRSRTRFLQINLNQTLPDIGDFDVIFLRNVMIYFDMETKRQVVARLAQRLRPGGLLIVGHSESLNGLTDALCPVQPTIYAKR